MLVSWDTNTGTHRSWAIRRGPSLYSEDKQVQGGSNVDLDQAATLMYTVHQISWQVSWQQYLQTHAYTIHNNTEKAPL